MAQSAGVAVTSAEVADEQARRRLGYGRGARMALSH
jgi:chorismate synthase